MPYALFSNDEKISKAFPTEHDVWEHADEAGLVVDVNSNDSEQSKRVLDQDYTIKPCEADALAEQPVRTPRVKESVSSR